MKKQKGFSLIELVVSVAILSIAVIALMQTFTLAARMNKQAGKDEKIQYLASNVMERIKAEDLNSWREKLKKEGSPIENVQIGQEEYTVTYEGPDSGAAGSNYTLTFTTVPDKSSETIYNGKYVAEAIVKTEDYSKAATPDDKGEQTVSSINNYRVPVVHNVTASHNFLLGKDELAADPAAVSLLAAKLEDQGNEGANAIDLKNGTGFHQYLQVRVFTKQVAGSVDPEKNDPAPETKETPVTEDDSDTSGNSTAQVTVQWRFLYSAAELGDATLNDINLSSSDADTFLIWPAEDPSSTADWFSRTLVAPYTGDIYRGLPLIDSVLTLQEPEKNTAEAGSGYGPGIEGIHIDDSAAANPIMLQISGFSSIYPDEKANKEADRLFQLKSGSNYSPNLQTGSTGRDRLFTVEVSVYEADSGGKKTGSALYSLKSTKSE